MAQSTHATGRSHDSRAATSPTTARLELPAAEFALATLFEQIPEAHVECQPAVTNPDDHALLVVRADAHDRSAVENALREDSTVGVVEYFAERTDEWTYRLTWDGHARELIRRVVAENTVVLNARAQRGQWSIRLVAPTRNAFASAYEAIEKLDCTPECRRISAFEGRTNRPTLTDSQQEALLEAFEAGYYNVPQDVTMDEVASRLGISHQALSERLHRACGSLIEQTLVVD